MSTPTQIETPEFATHIVNDIVRVEYERDIVDAILWRKRWKKIAYMLFIISRFLTLASSMFAFFEPYFKIGYLAMTSGCLSLMALYLVHCGEDALKMSSERTRIANEYLKVLQIEEFPQDGTVQEVDIKK